MLNHWLIRPMFAFKFAYYVGLHFRDPDVISSSLNIPFLSTYLLT